MKSCRRTEPRAKLYVILSFTLAAISLILAFSSPSQAGKSATFWVTNWEDDGRPGSLRWALDQANVRSGKNHIKFRVAGEIDLLTVLSVGSPSGEVVIDGFTAPPPGITLRQYGLCVNTSNNVIRGLKIIADNGGTGIHFCGKPQGVTLEYNLVEGNTITGFGSGVMFNQASKNVIRNNVLRGNWFGVFFHNESSNNNENIFEDNVIGNNVYGIGLSQGFGNIIRGNYIGLDRDGNPLPNGKPCDPPCTGIQGGGVVITGNADPSGPTITGSNTVGPGNVIAFNTGPGIVSYVASQAPGSTYTRNSIFNNPPGGGIVLGTDPSNPDGNLPLSPPTVLDTNPIAGTAPANSTVEIFFDGGDQGRFFIGSVKANGFGSFTSHFTLNGVLQGNVTATATDQYGNTSMFSEPVSIP